MSVSTDRQATEQLISTIQELSLAKDLETIMAVVRKAARELTGADGATFVLRDGDQCYYAEENAISPLWKGQRFPMSACISGWVMLNREHVIIEDIYQDDRIPADAYRPTFVKSLAMVPIRSRDPIGAIGNYWADTHRATEQEVRLLQALADSTSIAMENVQVYTELEQRVRDRTAELESTNRELESFSYSVSHDLRAPLRAVNGFSEILLSDYAEVLGEEGRDILQRIARAGLRMNQLIEDLLQLSRITRVQVDKRPVDLSEMAQEITAELQAAEPDRRVQVSIEQGLSATGDQRLLRIALENLLSNAWKYTSKKSDAVVEFASDAQADGSYQYCVRDNGAGFNMANAQKLFAPFQRMHGAEEFPGTGIGLATVQRIIHKHGGKIRAQATPEQGASFYFTLP